MLSCSPPRIFLFSTWTCLPLTKHKRIKNDNFSSRPLPSVARDAENAEGTYFSWNVENDTFQQNRIPCGYKILLLPLRGVKCGQNSSFSEFCPLAYLAFLCELCDLCEIQVSKVRRLAVHLTP